MKQFAVIGIGKFGYYLATRLYDKGHEVLAIDTDPVLVQKIRNNVTTAVVADSTDPETLKSLGLKDIDTVIVCIGSIISNSILTSLNLLEMGVKDVMAKCLSEAHERILRRIGVNLVFFPEKDLAISLAEKLHTPNLIDYFPFMEGYSIIQIAVPSHFVGKSLKDANINYKYGVQVIAVKEFIPERVTMIPTGDFIMKDSDMLTLLGPNKSLERMKK
ncbi:MAG: TrkA family potassium uptake protein [Proteobacteria bacterium]|nr:TrkA family potassium uptake protein [Pseudomonadota bacterium]